MERTDDVGLPLEHNRPKRKSKPKRNFIDREDKINHLINIKMV